MSEEWRPIPSLDGYEASDLGRIRSCRANRWGTGTDWREVKGCLNGAGYRHVKVTCPDGKKRQRTVHTLVAEAFRGPRPEGMEVCHGDGDSTNNAADNLRYDTPSANTTDSVGHGTHRWASKTHCPQGHPYAGENLYIDKTGGRVCRACRRARVAAHQQRRRTSGAA